jgi:PAS domain S-box-containing protein
LIIAAAILIGMTLLVGGWSLLQSESPWWLSLLATLLFALVSAGFGILLDDRLAKKCNPVETNNVQSQQQEAALLQINQDLFSRAQESAKELARLNIELQLEMAMHKQAEDAARISEERFRNMADNIQQGLTIIENGQLVYLNDRACEIYGDCPKGDFQNRILESAAPEEKARLNEVLLQSEHTGQFPRELEYWIMRKDGSRRCIRERYSQSSMHGITRAFIVTSDITESAQAYQILENAVSDRTRELSTVLDVSRRLASTLELEPLLDLILEQIQTIIPYTGAAIYTLEDDKLNAIAYQVPGLSPQDQSLYFTLPKDGPYQQVILEKKVLIIDDVKGDPPLAVALRESSSNPPVVSFEHARSWIGIPLVIRDQVTGLLSLVYSEPNYYTQLHARLAMTITNQLAVAIENARLYDQAQNLAVLEERQRIARELHDSVTQLLYGICLYCTATSRTIRSGNTAQVEKNLEEIKDNALQALQEMRLLILELNPPLLQKAGLVAALQASLEVIENRTGLATELKTEGIGRLPRAIEMELYRIAMEALNNLVRYARAKKVTVELRARDGRVCIEICDNGVGFDLARAKESGGMGIHNMEQRARQIGGTLEITSHPGSGTQIKVVAPIEARWKQPALN